MADDDYPEAIRAQRPLSARRHDGQEGDYRTRTGTAVGTNTTHLIPGDPAHYELVELRGPSHAGHFKFHALANECGPIADAELDHYTASIGLKGLRRQR